MQKIYHKTRKTNKGKQSQKVTDALTLSIYLCKAETPDAFATQKRSGDFW
jgi:hypothetical protein